MVTAGDHATDLLTALTSLAVSVFRERSSDSYVALENEVFDLFWTADSLLAEAQRYSLLIPTRHAGIEQFARLLASNREFDVIAPRVGELDAMMLHAGGGSRLSLTSLVAGLFTAAYLRIFFLRLPETESTFVRAVLENFEELRAALRGEEIKADVLLGLSGVRLPAGSNITTPWGTIRPAAEFPQARLAWPRGLETTCVLSDQRVLPVRIDRAAQPKSDFDPALADPGRSRVLLPLSFALASPDANSPVVPIPTWSTLVLPFQHGLGFSYPAVTPAVKAAVDVADRARSVEEWSRVVESSHTLTTEIAARRLASAAAHRLDRADALIDAVMVWENLVGTTSETTFRVTGALAKALETDPAKRRELRKSLGRTYDVRSKVVHGSAVDPGKLEEAATEAINVAVRALRYAYRRDRDWLSLSSTERADSLLLEEP